MTPINRWIAMSFENKDNSHFDEQQLSLLSPAVIILPNARTWWAAKSTSCKATAKELKPFFDDRYKSDFKLLNLNQIKAGSTKHRIWIGDILPKFNPKHEGHIARLEFKLKQEFVKELMKDECLTFEQQETYQRVGFALIEVFGKTIFNTMVGEYNV